LPGSIPRGDITVKCAIYVRVSTEEQAQEGYSLDEQEKRCRAHCESKGDEIFRIYRDEGVSGRSTKGRAAYSRMLDEMAEWEKLVFWKLDRVHRNAMNFMEMSILLNDAGKEFASVVDNIDTGTAMGRFALDLFVRIAQLESDITGERTSMGLTARVESGDWITRPPFGYDLTPVDPEDPVSRSRLSINAHEADIVRYIFELHHDSGLSPFKISRLLNEKVLEGEDCRTKTGKLWAQSGVKAILENPIYFGKIRHRVKRSGGRFEYQLIYGNHEPIFDLNEDACYLPSILKTETED